MPHSFPFRAIVLKTYDVGEADRYCILFTRERGRLSARASGARRLQSRLGAMLLPFQQVTVQLKESSAGFIVAGVLPSGETLERFARLRAFADAEQGTELLLSLLHEEEPLPEIFDATSTFLHSCGTAPHQVLAFTLRLLSLLGLLPGQKELRNFLDPSPIESRFMEAALRGISLSFLENPKRLDRLCAFLLEDQLKSPLRAGKVVLS
ncbi:DNA repair protein RecO [Candidatus Peregrinibacteria bacterium]|nr:DNA repair protein RecO [Candidatus Peregrinibacteria bacterium]MBI3816043.1 DNA repair protein RecO [Candidatus Peregrinibacteria bacterium]